jgi:glycosyltransferase involved in cell wall biosynthesis
VTLHGIDVAASDRTLITSGNASWIKLLMNRRYLGSQVARFLGVSDYICHLAGRYYPRKKIVKSFLGIDESQFEFSEVSGGKMILHIGRLVEKKGAIYLLQAFAKIRQEVSDAMLVIVGDGPLAPEIKACIGSHRLSESVRIIPKASREEIVSLVKQCRLFCLPSVTAANGDTEGLPVSVLEAMAVGRPVISTWHAGIPEAIEDGKSGYLVQERDVDALAARIKELLGNLDRCRAMGAEGRRAVETRFSLAACAQETERVYSEVLANKSFAQNQ